MMSCTPANLVATYQRLVKCGWLYGGIDPATGRTARPTKWTPVEQAIVIAELDDRHGTDDWTPAEIDAIRAEAVEILRGEHADPRNSALKSSAGNTSGVIRPPTDLHGVFRGKHPAGRLPKSRSPRSSGR